MTTARDDIEALRASIDVGPPRPERTFAAIRRENALRALLLRLSLRRLVDFVKAQIEALLPKLDPARPEVAWARRTLPKIAGWPATPPTEADWRDIAFDTLVSDAVVSLWRASSEWPQDPDLARKDAGDALLGRLAAEEESLWALDEPELHRQERESVPERSRARTVPAG